MPFTPTHTLAILPLVIWLPRLLPPSALAIGSMIPDLPLFIPVGIDYYTTHTWLGIFTACIPLGLITLFVFHRYLKRALLLLSPIKLRERLHRFEYSERNWNAKLLVADAIALALGAATHIVWDAFTHADRWGVDLFPVLKTMTIVAGFHVPVYKLLQHGSSLIGLPLLALLFFKWLKQQTPQAPAYTLLPALRHSVIFVLTIVPLGLAVVAGFTKSIYSLETVAFYIVTAAIGSFCLLLLLFGLSVDWFQQRLLVASAPR